MTLECVLLGQYNCKIPIIRNLLVIILFHKTSFEFVFLYNPLIKKQKWIFNFMFSNPVVLPTEHVPNTNEKEYFKILDRLQFYTA